jgi:hypothetical protein
MVTNYWFTLSSISICRILDIFTTQIALNSGAYETNPFARFIFNMIGINNIIYLIPFHILITIIGVYCIYYVIDHTAIHDDSFGFYFKLWDSIIISLILLNIACPINNLLVIGGVI